MTILCAELWPLLQALQQFAPQEVPETRKQPGRIYKRGTLTWWWLPCDFLSSVWVPTNVTQ